MRRKEYEVTDPLQTDAVIMACDCCRLGLADGVKPYVVPMNFGYERQAGRPVFYFHGSREGRRMELIRKNGYAGFELDTGHRLRTHEKACGHSFIYQSVIGAGRISEVTEEQEKKHGLSVLMRQLTGREDWEFEAGGLHKAAVFRLDVEEMSCKEQKS